MSDKDIFNQSSEGSNDENKDDIFNNMVGEDKQYKSPQELAKGKQEADAFIEQIKQENKELREDLDKRLTAEETLQKIKESSTENQDGDNQSKLSPEEIKDLVAGTVKDINSQSQLQSNLDKATSMMINKYGDKANEVLAQKALELGLPVSDLKQTASRSPMAFAQLVGLDTTPNSATKGSNGTVNTQALDANGGNHRGPEHGTYAYYESIRKANPRDYYSPKVQNEMFQKRKELGDKFYS